MKTSNQSWTTGRALSFFVICTGVILLLWGIGTWPGMDEPGFGYTEWMSTCDSPFLSTFDQIRCNTLTAASDSSFTKSLLGVVTLGAGIVGFVLTGRKTAIDNE